MGLALREDWAEIAAEVCESRSQSRQSAGIYCERGVWRGGPRGTLKSSGVQRVEASWEEWGWGHGKKSIRGWASPGSAVARPERTEATAFSPQVLSLSFGFSPAASVEWWEPKQIGVSEGWKGGRKVEALSTNISFKEPFDAEEMRGNHRSRTLRVYLRMESLPAGHGEGAGEGHTHFLDSSSEIVFRA